MPLITCGTASSDLEEWNKYRRRDGYEILFIIKQIELTKVSSTIVVMCIRATYKTVLHYACLSTSR